MLARRLALSVPLRARGCAFITKMKEMEAAAGKLAPTMPEELRPIAEAGVRRDARHIFFPPLNRFFALLLL